MSEVKTHTALKPRYGFETQAGLDSLSSKERAIWREIRKPGAGVLFLKGYSGNAKTALPISIAEKLGLQLITLRLSTMAAEDIKGIPRVVERDGRQVFEYIISEQLRSANDRPSLILLDELNRAQKSELDAILQILNERKVDDYAFNEEVFLVATGNLGEKDGNEVADMESAMLQRLRPKEMFLTVAEWVEGYAAKKVWGAVVDFLKTDKGLQLFNITDPKSSQLDWESYPTPRRWTQFSQAVLFDFAEEGSLKPKIDEELIRYVETEGGAYLGASPTGHFITFLKDISAYSLRDVITRLDTDADMRKSLKRNGGAASMPVLESLIEAHAAGLFSRPGDGNAKEGAYFLDEKSLSNIKSFLYDGYVSSNQRVAWMDQVLDVNGKHADMGRHTSVVLSSCPLFNYLLGKPGGFNSLTPQDLDELSRGNVFIRELSIIKELNTK